MNGFPIVSLVARVGEGDLQFVGTSPTQLTVSGELVLYINDNFFGDNPGAWTVEVSYDCYPGNGFGGSNHYHCKKICQSVERKNSTTSRPMGFLIKCGGKVTIFSLNSRFDLNKKKLLTLFLKSL